MAEIIKARVWQKIDTEANWNDNPLILGPGEQAFVVSSAGVPINFKIGDGTKRFSDLPWWIQYDGGQYIQIAGNVLPDPTVDVGYSLVGPGTYTFSGQADVVAPEGRLSQLLWDGTSWSLVDMGELPQAENKILPWTGATPAGEQRLHDGQLWTATTATLEGDEPGVSSKWVPELDIVKTEGIYGKNRFDKSTVTAGHYINYTNGSVGPNSSYSASDYIFVGDLDNITISNYIHCAFYDRNKTFIIGFSYAVDGATVNAPRTIARPEGAVYLRISTGIAYINSQQVESGTQATEYTPYEYSFGISSEFPARAITDDLLQTIIDSFEIESNSVTPAKTTFAETREIIGKNLFNKNVPEENIGRYVNWNNGTLSNGATYSSSDYILISEEQDYYLTLFYHYAWYDENKVFISGGQIGAEGSAALTAPSGARFLRASTTVNRLNIAQIEKGSEPTPYEDYYSLGPKVVIPELYIEKEEDAAEIPDIFIPSEIYIAEDYEYNIYFRNAIVPPFGDRLDNYTIDINGSKGRNFENFFRFTPTAADVGSSGLGIYLYEKSANIKTSSTSLKVASKNAGNGVTRKVLIIGDSTVDGGDINVPLKSNFDTDVMNIQFIGTRGATGLKHEGFAGWTIKDFATIGRAMYRFYVTGALIPPSIGATYSIVGTLRVEEVNITDGIGYFSMVHVSGIAPDDMGPGSMTKVSGDGPETITYDSMELESTNPFWNPTTSKFDLGMYLTNTGQSIDSNDWVFFQLGINDVFGQTNMESAKTKAETMWVQLKDIMDSIQEYNPNIRIGVIGTIPPAASQDAFGSSYSNGQTRERYFKTGWAAWHRVLTKELDTAENKTAKRYLIPAHLNIDTVNNFPKTLADANARNSTDKITRLNNGVHPALSGNAQIADSYTGAIKYFE